MTVPPRDESLLQRLEIIPAELIQRRQWVCWRYEVRDGKPTKVPCMPNGNRADSTNPGTWSTFDQAVAGFAGDEQMAGIGYVFAADDPYAGVDLDDCMAGDQVCAEAQAIIDRLNTYAEVSPSGGGVKLFAIGAKPGARCKTTKVKGFKELEMYDRDRFFTVTGMKLDRSPGSIRDCTSEISALYREVFEQPLPPPPPMMRSRNVAVPESDDEVLRRVRASKQGAKFDRLWSGGVHDYGGDQSAADLALCCILAFWTGRDRSRMDSLFRQSGLMRPKWTARRGSQTYGELTITTAIEHTREVYRPGHEPPPDWPPREMVQRSVGALSEFEQYQEDTIAGRRRALPWPWSFITSQTQALMPGCLTIVCGNPGATKSFFVLEAAAFWHDLGERPAVLMLEDGRTYHMNRALAQRVRERNLTDVAWVEANGAIARQHRQQNAVWLESFGACIYEPETSDLITHDAIADWVESAARAKKSPIVVDPISIADSEHEQYRADKRLVGRLKKIAETHGARIVCVTHPAKNAKGSSLDDVSGGAAVTRFAQTVLWLRYMPEPETAQVLDVMTRLPIYQEINRMVVISKARNGIGTGRRVGLKFVPESLSFDEKGLVL